LDDKGVREEEMCRILTPKKPSASVKPVINQGLIEALLLDFEE